MYKITKQKKIELEERLAFLENVEKKRINEMMADNKMIESTHKYAQVVAEKNAFEKELFEVQNALKNSQILDENSIDKSSVGIGCFVDILISAETKSFQIVSSIEADPKISKISNDSPIGKAIFGKRAGDKVVLESGREIEIVKIY